MPNIFLSGKKPYAPARWGSFFFALTLLVGVVCPASIVRLRLVAARSGEALPAPAWRFAETSRRDESRSGLVLRRDESPRRRAGD
jgi:hypothetical protein